MADSDNTPPHAAPPGSRRLLATVLILALVAIAALAFGWPTRHGAFLSGDDQRFVTEQVFVNHPSLRHALRLLTMIHGDLYQPLPMLTFQADYALAAPDPSGRFGISPYAFHLTNIVLHALNAVLACLVALRLARCRRVALLTGLMFACHPLALEPVAWVSGRMILLATTFSLLLILVCLCRRPDGHGAWPWLAGISWLLALASKVLPTVPVAAALCDYHRHGRLPRRAWITYAMLLVVTAAATWLAVSATSGFGMIESTAAESTTSAPVRILLAARSYLENYIWPSRLAAWSPPPDNVHFLSGAVAIALAECIAGLVAVALAWRYNRLCFLGLILFPILLAPFLGATTARRLLVADRYMYLPMLGLHLALAAVFVQLGDTLAKRMRPATAATPTAAPIVALLVVWLLLGWRYAPCWADSVARDRRVAEVYPDRLEAHIELARSYVFQGQPDAALAAIGKARLRWPDDARLASEAGEAYRLTQDWPHAADELAHAATRLPGRTRTQYYYALTLDQLGRTEEARDRYEAILQRDPIFLPAVTALARSYRAAGDVPAAIDLFEQALQLNPYHRDSLFELALLYIHDRRWREAEPLLRRILDLDPTDAPALLNLGVTLANLGRNDDALAAYDRLLAAVPDAIAARLNKAGLLASLRRAVEAEYEYQLALRDQPDSLSAAAGLSELLQEQKRFDELVDFWSAEVSAAVHPPDAQAWLVWALVLAGRAPAALAAATAVPSDSPARSFVDWALAYDALRRNDTTEFRRRLGPPSFISDVPAARREEARVMLAALAVLPQDLRESLPGLYALARAFLFGGDVAAARSAASRIPVPADDTGWSEDLRALADLLAGPASRPASTGEAPR